MQKFLFIVFLLLLPSCREQNKLEKDPDPVFSNREALLNPTRNLLTIIHLKEGDKISSPLLLEGRARGYWFFEADAPVVLLDENYRIIAQTHITAIGDWMTEDWVEFQGKLNFPDPQTKTGFIIFHKANPSGLEEHSNSDTIRVAFE